MAYDSDKKVIAGSRILMVTAVPAQVLPPRCRAGLCPGPCLTARLSTVSSVTECYSVFKVLSADPLHLHGLGRAEKQGSYESFWKRHVLTGAR